MRRLVKGCAIGCAVLVVLIAVSIFAGAKWLQTTFGSPKPPDPKIGAYVALRPLFRVKGGDPYSAGTAVAVRMQPGGKPILLTAQHLFGPAGGMDQQLQPDQVNSKIAGVSLLAIGGEKPIGTAQGSLRKTGPPLDETMDDVSSDLAAFNLGAKSRVNALDLAAGNPGMGEWVWLVGDEVDHEPQKQRLFPARVIVVNDKKTLVRFEPEVTLQAFSGAPLINDKKQVVGLLIGGAGPMGIINPAASIRQRLGESGIK